MVVKQPASIHAVPFPGGIAEPAGGRAALCDHQRRVLAVDLVHGLLQWRTPVPLVPLLVLPDSVIALQLSPAPACVAVAWQGTGQATWTSQALPMAAWVAAGALRDIDLELSAAADPRRLWLRWRAHDHYRGGAAPSPRIEEQASREEDVTVAVDRRSGVVHTATESPVLRSLPNPMPAFGRDRRDVDLGARRFELAVDTTDAGVARSVLRATDARDGHRLWELVIDEAPVRRPPPLRA